MDRSLDIPIASILSTLEDTCTYDAAKDALLACHGNVERAILRILDNRAPPVPIPLPPDLGVIDLDLSSESGAEEARSKRQKTSDDHRPLTTPSQSKRSDDHHPLTTPAATITTACSSTSLPSASRHQPSSSSTALQPGEPFEHQPSVPADKQPLGFAVRGLVGKMVGAGSAAISKALGIHQTGIPNKKADAMSDSWNVFGGEVPHPSISDPPCLSLAGMSSEDLQQHSTGKLHCGRGLDSSSGESRSFQLRQLERAVEFKDIKGKRSIKIKDKQLQMLFEDMVSRVRYAPAAMECSWRIVEQSGSKQKGDTVPADLKGQLPKRPFSLLNNADDSEALQPPGFLKYRLRPEQLRSLSWMLAREGYGAEPEPFLVEWRRFWKPFNDACTEEWPSPVVQNAVVKLSDEADSDGEDIRGQKGIVVTADNYHQVAKVNFFGGGAGMVTADLPFADLEVVQKSAIHIGSLVEVRRDVKNPSFGWGTLTHGVVGVVKSINQSDNSANVYFPETSSSKGHMSWKGLISELQRVEPSSHQPDSKAFTLDLRIRASYNVGGGILGDKIGYGKTATTIALIDSTKHLPLPEVPQRDRDRFIPAKGTLIIVPSNLLDQWLSEFSKFLWDGSRLKTQMKRGWSPKSSPLKIFAMTMVTPLTTATAKEIAEADVVICSYRLLFSPIYHERYKALLADGCFSGLTGLAQKTRSFLRGDREMASGRKSDSMVRTWEELTFPLLEMFYWRRVVFDEFHELESFESKQQNILQHLRAHYRWGLTGTPPVSCNAGAIFMSSLFRVDLPGYLHRNNGRLPYEAPDLSPWESDRLLSDVSGRFLDHFVRQNTAELPHIKLEEHVVFVRHTASERALYLGQAHDAPDLSSDDAFATEENRQALERLLKLCSHFQAVGAFTSNAKEECSRIGEAKERKVVRARNQLHRCGRVLFLLMNKLPSASRSTAKVKKALSALDAAKEKLAGSGENGEAVVKLLADIDKEVVAEDGNSRLDVLNEHKPKNEEFAAVIGQPEDKRKGYSECWAAFIMKQTPIADVISYLTSQASEQADNLQEFKEAHSSLCFWNRTVDALVADNATRTCAVCLEEGLPLDQLSITPCAHTFCISCLKMTVEQFHSCSICRQKLTVKDIRPLCQEIVEKKGDASTQLASASKVQVGGASSSSATPPKKPSEEDEMAARHGTKLATVVHKLQQLRSEDPTAKVILFVQFDDLKRKVAGALLDFGIPAVQLQGATSQRANIIYDWQNNPNSVSFVLLLSLEQSASGTNLTAASHVVFLHPMLAHSAEMALAHELQAIGRARRHGQVRDTVHVWRFVTRDTVEQTMTEKHQAALFARENARDERESAAAAAGAAGAAEADPVAAAEDEPPAAEGDADADAGGADAGAGRDNEASQPAAASAAASSAAGRSPPQRREPSNAASPASAQSSHSGSRSSKHRRASSAVPASDAADGPAEKRQRQE